jgi:hypothetical protein
MASYLLGQTVPITTASDWLQGTYTIYDISYQIGAKVYPLICGLILLKAIGRA